MEFNKDFLGKLFEKATMNPRLRQSFDLRTSAENGGYPPTQNGDIRSLFWLFSLMALQN